MLKLPFFAVTFPYPQSSLTDFTGHMAEINTVYDATGGQTESDWINSNRRHQWARNIFRAYCKPLTEAILTCSNVTGDSERKSVEECVALTLRSELQSKRSIFASADLLVDSQKGFIFQCEYQLIRNTLMRLALFKKKPRKIASKPVRSALAKVRQRDILFDDRFNRLVKELEQLRQAILKDRGFHG
jgi:hypothetical protein